MLDEDGFEPGIRGEKRSSPAAEPFGVKRRLGMNVSTDDDERPTPLAAAVVVLGEDGAKVGGGDRRRRQDLVEGGGVRAVVEEGFAGE